MQFTMLALALGVVAVAAEPVQQDNEFAAMITSTPKLPRHLVAIRQQDEDAEGCDYVELSDALVELNCPADSGGCTTSGDFYGCNTYFATTCYDFGDEACPTESVGLINEHWCCNEGWPNCATMVMDDAGTTRTHFECYDFLSGSLSALAPSDVDTSASNSLGVTTITAPPPDVTDNQSTSGTSPPSTTPTDGNGGGGGGGDDDKGEAAPVGAIVGGVIGGVALLAAVGFGFWFMRRWKKNHGDAPAVTPATTQPTVYTGSPGTTAGGAYYAPVPQGYPPQGYPVQHYDPSKPYIPNEPVEAPSESAPRPPQNPPQELQ